MGISSEEFYDMSPVELYYSFKAVGEVREEEFKQRLISSRMEAFMIINNQIGMKPEWVLKKETDLGYLFFEEGYEEAKKGTRKEVKQSPEEMKAILLGIAKTHNKNVARKTRTTPPKTGKYFKNQE